MARPSTPANTTIGTYTPLNTSNSGPKTVNVVAPAPSGTTANDACTIGADMAIWDTGAAVFVRPDQTNVGAND